MIPRRVFWLSDVFCVLLAFALAHALWPAFRGTAADLDGILSFDWFRPALAAASPPSPRATFWIVTLVGPAIICFLEAFFAYEPLLAQSRARIVITSLAAAISASGLITLVLFAEKTVGWSRLFMALFTIFAGLGLATSRLLMRHYFVRRRDLGFYAKNVLVIADDASVAWLVHFFRDNISENEFRLFGVLTFGSRSPTESIEGSPVLGTVEDLGKLVVHKPIHEVIVIQPSTSTPADLRQIVTQCDYFRVGLRIVPQGLLEATPSDLMFLYRNDPLGLPAVVLSPSHFDSDALFFKRVFDIVVSAILLLLLSPLFLLIAIAIKIFDRKASIFYRWNVVGKNGVRFTGFKFTTMYADADPRRNELLDRNEMTGPVFKIKDDPRITPLGKFLRKYSLNELPQLWSVLKGDMSLVGPRPAFPHELEGYGLWHKRKLSIRPGMTCLWQVSGRNRISNFDDWVKLDLEYIDKWSLWLDFKILARTAWAVVAGTGS